MNTTELRKIMAEVQGGISIINTKLNYLAHACEAMDEMERVQKKANIIAKEMADRMKQAKFQTIVQTVASVFQVPVLDMMKRPCKSQHLSIPNHVAMALCRATGDASITKTVGQFFKTHRSMVNCAMKHVEDLRETDAKFDAQVRMIEERLKGKV